jgi:hypothetical protein
MAANLLRRVMRQLGLRGNFMCVRAYIFVLFALLSQALTASAESVTRTVGGKSFNFALPEGQCPLEDGNPYDANFIHTIGTLLKGARNTLIAAAMECERRAALRKGEVGNVFDYAAYYTPDIYAAKAPPGETQSMRKQICVQLRKQGDASLASVKDIVAAQAKELQADIAVTSTRYIGVLAEDQHGCYAGLLVGVKGADNKPILMSSIVTGTAVHSQPLFLAIYSEYKGPETTSAGVEAAKATMAELDRTNP